MSVIEMYTDGSALGNPGPAGIGIFLRYGKLERQISQPIGNSTNNIAELTAIKVGLETITDSTIPIIIYTDSQYAQGVLTKNWKPKANQELILSIKNIMTKFKSITINHVYGHKGHPENEIANSLAIAGAKANS